LIIAIVALLMAHQPVGTELSTILYAQLFQELNRPLKLPIQPICQTPLLYVPIPPRFQAWLGFLQSV